MLLGMVFNGIGHFLDGYALEAGVVEKTTKTKELELSDGEKSWKKPKVDDLNQSSASEFDVDGSRELSGNVEVEVVATESSPRKKLDDDTLPETSKGILCL